MSADPSFRPPSSPPKLSGVEPRPGAGSFFRGLTLALGVYLLRLALLGWQEEPLPYFYADSAAHVTIHWMTEFDSLFWSLTAWPNRWVHLLVHGGADILYAPIILNALGGGLCVFFLYATLCRVVSWPVALAGTLGGVSVPAFSRLVYSGQPEMTAIALSCFALWVLASWRGEDVPAFAAHTAALAALALAFYTRAEFLSVYGMAGLLIMWHWRRSPNAVLLFVLMAFGWFYAGLQGVASHGLKATEGNSLVPLSWGERFTRFPLWFVDWNNFPFNFLILLSPLIFWVKDVPRWVRVGTGVLLVQGFLLWGASWFYLFSWEIERNLAWVFFALAGPVTVLLDRGLPGRLRRARPWVGLFFLALAAGSWRWRIPEAYPLPEAIAQARELGWRARVFLREEGAQGFVLLDAEDRDWPNVVVFSGAPQRVRLVPSPATQWASQMLWRGEKDVVLVIAPAARRSFLEKALGPLEEISRKGPRSFYRLAEGS